MASGGHGLGPAVREPQPMHGMGNVKERMFGGENVGLRPSALSNLRHPGYAGWEGGFETRPYDGGTNDGGGAGEAGAQPPFLGSSISISRPCRKPLAM